MKRYWKHLIALSTVLVMLLTSCTTKGSVTADILSQKVADPARTPVTVLVKKAFTINTFEKAAEEKFPNLDIIQVSNYSSNMGTLEYETRLSHGDLTDIVMTWPLEVGENSWEDQLIDLSSLPLTNRYNTSMLNTISRDGKLYYLPGPSQVRAILYNKTLFNEKGWKVPSDFEGFISLCHQIEESGMRSLQLGLGNAEVLDTAFVGFGNAEGFSKPENAQWLADYNNGVGSLGDHFGPALDTFQRLIDEGILKESDLQVYYQDREQMFFTRQCAMVEDSVLMARMGEQKTGSTDEFGLMPFFNPGSGDADWARLYPVCYIGLNKKLADPVNKEKYDLILSLMDYISTPEGQDALMGDTGAMFSSLRGMDLSDVPEITDLIPALTHGRYSVFPTLKNAQGAMRKGLAGMVAGTLTSEDVIKMVDAENSSPPIPPPPQVMGTATEDFSQIETSNYLTDAMRSAANCEIALFLDNGKDGLDNGKGLSGRMYAGEQTSNDIIRILPDWRAGEKGELQKITMTGENLLNALEYALPIDHDIAGWFYYFSGLTMEYAPAAKPGNRIRKITDAEGKAIDPTRIYTVAISDGSIKKDYIKTVEDTGITISELLTNSIIADKTISPSKDGRFTVCDP